MARNRKRAKDRRARRPQPVASNRGSAAQAPEPIAHATPDVELAQAQLAAGRPAEPEPDEGANEDEFDFEVEESIAGGDGGRGADFPGGGSGGGSGGDEIALPDAGKVTLRVRSPVKCRMLFFRDGQALQELKDSAQAELSVDSKGVYRVELYLDQLGGFLEGKPWVISNPIFVR